MLWWPQHAQTIVLPIGGLTASELLKFHTRAPQPAQEEVPGPLKGKPLFNGTITDTSFTISRRVSYPENALPVVRGRIESSSRGCIIHLRYQPFRSSIIFLCFWMLIGLCLAFFFWMGNKGPLWIALALASLPINYLIIVVNFTRQVRRTNEDLYAVFKDVLE